MKLDTVYVLYICNEINLALIYEETFDKENYEKNNNDLIGSFNFIIDNLDSEKLCLVDDTIALTDHRFGFEHIHKIEDETKTLFKLFYIENINDMFKKIKKYNNIAYYEIDKAFGIIEDKKSTGVSKIIDEYCRKVKYINIKEQMIKNNTFEFFPFSAWIKSKEVDESKITKITIWEEHTIINNRSNNKVPIDDEDF